MTPSPAAVITQEIIMPDVLASILTKVGIAVLEALAVRLLQALFDVMFRQVRMA